MARKFTDEFKRDAFRLANEIGNQETADKLDIKIKNIYTWRKAERILNGSSVVKVCCLVKLLSKVSRDCKKRAMNYIKLTMF